jgi:long-chain acyl-CoA synthetase
VQFLLLPLFDRLFHKKIREKFGNRFRFAISGGAALDFTIARLFISLGVEIAQGYGLTEFSPVISVNRLDDNDPRSVGVPLPGVETRINENEELLVKGKSIMQGYWKNEQATHQIIDENGWLHTGDKASIVDGKITITGRIKDIIVLSTGEKIPPCEVEQSIMQDPLFENIVVVGENRPYLSALVIPNDELSKKLTNGTGSLNDELLEHIKIKMSAFPGYARVHKVSICEEPWTIENGMLTPTLKPRRKFIIDQYKNMIDEMYHNH